ncbi:MAG: universal stress protein [Bacteroidota bacterium]
MSLKTILVPLDYSDHSFNALRIAINLVKQFDARLLLLHSHDVSSSTSMSHYRGLLDSISDSVKQELMDELKMASNTFKELGTMNVDYKVTLGSATEDIQRTAEEENVDLIVMGTKGRSNRLKQRFGSNSSEISVRAKCSVLVIPAGCDELNLDKIVLAADYHLADELGDLSVLRELSLKNNAEVTILNITDVPDALNNKEAQEAMEIHSYLEDVKHKFDQVTDTDVHNALLKYAKENANGLIAVTPNKHHFFHKIFHIGHTEELAMDTSIPMLAIHD